MIQLELTKEILALYETELKGAGIVRASAIKKDFKISTYQKGWIQFLRAIEDEIDKEKPNK